MEWRKRGRARRVASERERPLLFVAQPNHFAVNANVGLQRTARHSRSRGGGGSRGRGRGRGRGGGGGSVQLRVGARVSGVEACARRRFEACVVGAEAAALALEEFEVVGCGRAKV